MRRDLLPRAKPTSKGAMKTFQSSLVSNLLLPHRHVGTIISDVWVEGRKRRAEDYERRLLGLEVRLKVCARTFAGHCENMSAKGT